MTPTMYVLRQLEPLAHELAAAFVAGAVRFAAAAAVALAVAAVAGVLRRSFKETPLRAYGNGRSGRTDGAQHVLMAAAALVLAPGTVAATVDCSHLPPPTGPAIEANENREPAGTMARGELAVQLVVRQGSWYPDGPGGCGLNVLAFAEGDGAASIPGPLIRVRAGTRVQVTIRNPLDRAIVLRGLQSRPAETMEPVRVEAGGTATVPFEATGAGSYFYYARLADAGEGCCNEDRQLAGALVVEPAEGAAPDRVLVLTRWSPPGYMPLSQLADADTTVRRYELNVINGRSWPHTERLTYTTGDTVRLRVINAGGDVHIMHLHGFHFRLTSRGDNAVQQAFAPGAAPVLVSEVVLPDESITLEWIPTRPGNWIFHCHLARHMSSAQRLDRMPGSAQVHHEGAAHAEHDMGGLVVGVSVEPAPGYVEPEEVLRRRLRLFANTRPRVFGPHPGLGFVLQEDDREPAADSVRLPGSPLLLRRGEPTEIVVHNRIGRPLSVHWHGLELESFFDGVAGWSGVADRIAPPITPGDSFAVRITPPRAGTFIYHVHHGEPLDLASGLYGAFIVLDDSARLELPANDRLFVISRQPGDDNAIVVNGSRSPEPVRLVAGEMYRFRFIGIMPGEGDGILLDDPAGIAHWEVVARDGVDGSIVTAPFASVGAGMTLDFSLNATAAGTATLVLLTFDAFGEVVGQLRIPVAVDIAGRPPQEPPVVAMIGTGNVGGTLGPRIAELGYPVVYGSRDPERASVRELVTRSGAKASAATQSEAAARAAIVILAVPGHALEEVSRDLGRLDGKIVVDITSTPKRVAPDGYLELTADSANSERLQARQPAARVVRMFIPSANLFREPLALGTAPTVPLAGNDPHAKEVVASILFDIGLDPWDAGPLRFARSLDALGLMVLVPLQQGRSEGVELKLLRSSALPCFLDLPDAFGFGRPYDFDDPAQFPRLEPPISCEVWRRSMSFREAR
jgi:manganese oxidase